jgi:hypothetical protein
MVSVFYIITIVLYQISSSNSMEAFGQMFGPTITPPSLGQRVPALKFSATNYIVPIQVNGTLANTTAIRLLFNIADSKTNQTFSWITYIIDIRKVEDNGTTSSIPIFYEFFLSQYGPLILNIEQPTKEEQPCFSITAGNPCDSAMNVDGALLC